MSEDEWQFESISKPGLTQMPNELYDEIQSNVDPYTFAIASAIFREYFGWHADAPQPLSLNELIRRTGISRNRVIKSIRLAEERGIIVCIREEVLPDLKIKYIPGLSGPARVPARAGRNA